jgi:hypothetical protein
MKMKQMHVHQGRGDPGSKKLFQNNVAGSVGEYTKKNYVGVYSSFQTLF